MDHLAIQKWIGMNIEHNMELGSFLIEAMPQCQKCAKHRLSQPKPETCACSKDFGPDQKNIPEIQYLERKTRFFPEMVITAKARD